VTHRSTTDDSLLLQKKEEEHAYLFQYGITSGLWEFREELAKFLSAKYGDKVHRYIKIYCHKYSKRVCVRHKSASCHVVAIRAAV
jgi:hypothetical protein